MFQNYLQLLGDLFEKVFHHTGGEVTFLDYLSAVGMGILLLLIVVVIIAGTIGLFFFPYKGYSFFVKNINQKLSDAVENGNYEEITSLEKSKRKKSIFYWTCLFVVYVPFAIPTVLYIIYLLTSIL